jgi:4-hydroxythreonine-4-phosphate dehydrogenase
MEGAVDAIVTPPINKAGLQKAGFDIPGHTEFLAALSKTKKFEMMLIGGGLRVVHVTRHVPLKKVSSGVTAARIREALALTELEMRRSFGVRRPRLAVAGLNPHAGEEGHIGDEELRVIGPAVRAAKKNARCRIDGPIPPDVLFYQAYSGLYDAEICMYHDQGLIPLKMISRGAGVNFTLGLPFVRTSPDHGTAYDIASKFRADAGSMTEAVRLAVLFSRNRKRHV